MKKNRNYTDDLNRDLKDPKVAIEYLNAVLQENDDSAFLLALQDVAKAHGGMSKLSRISKMPRITLYRMLSKEGNPEIHTLRNLLRSMGFKLAVVQDKDVFKRAA